MFLDELTPLVKELTANPVAFLGGFFSGVFRLSLGDDPVKSWLDQNIGGGSYATTPTTTLNGNNGGPQSISIE
ncbi:MAG: hypothetical protein SFY66_13985 [Oculatellaceae cyanobacterium bins.114]|nr:hypothetical protein [Oculatellaceae cyanobacterium bins.114]